jgi:hypothetical protein
VRRQEAITSAMDNRNSSKLSFALRNVLLNSVKFLKCPLSDEEMHAIWHYGYPVELISAINVLQQHGFPVQCSTRSATFVVADYQYLGRGIGIRFFIDHGRNFLQIPRQGPLRIMMKPVGSTYIRPVPYQVFYDVLGNDARDKVFEWAISAATMNERHAGAKKAVDDIIKMCSTAGQLRRMVPELVKYLPPDLQSHLAEQTRASPFPDQWATYPKDNVEKMLSALAEGHLLTGLGKQELSDSGYTWAEFTPR